ncbi:MAG: hypothetical protein H6551_07645 [Chitinophagales bacterium]|nr:hypothetical protein [Chitinophagaceae bacterium]MCB9065003.1 hypothetical protein [Chitinophagales bacterium]
MKNLIPVIALLMIAALGSSCKKKYSCVCRATLNINQVTSTKIVTAKSKDDAQIICETNALSISCNIE